MAKAVKNKQKRRKTTKKRSGCTLTPTNRNGNGNKVGRKNGVLTVKEKLFIEDYLKHFNATRAYLEVYNTCSPETAGVEGHVTLKKPKVMAEIDRRLSALFTKLEIDNDMLIAEYAKHAFIDTRSFFIDNVFVGMNQLNIAQQSCIESVETEGIYVGRGAERRQIGTTTKIRFYSRKAAMDSLMKYKGLIKDTVNNNTIILNDNKTEVVMVAAKELKETLSANRITELNKLLKETSSN